MPFTAETFDAALSNFGLIFAVDPARVIVEAHRCLRPGSLLAFTAWTPGGWPGPCRTILASALGQPAPGFPTSLGRRERVRRLLDSCGFDMAEAESGTLRWSFEDIDHAVDTLTTAAGGLRVLRLRAEAAAVWPTARPRLGAELARRSMPIHEGIAVDDGYLAIVGRRRDPP
jgi:SAM-dependent methyltransferase